MLKEVGFKGLICCNIRRQISVSRCGLSCTFIDILNSVHSSPQCTRKRSYMYVSVRFVGVTLLSASDWAYGARRCSYVNVPCGFASFVVPSPLIADTNHFPTQTAIMRSQLI
jgi:hypothetical protein